MMEKSGFRFDILQANIVQISKAVLAYREELVKAGVPEREAQELTIAFQGNVLVGLMMVMSQGEGWE